MPVHANASSVATITVHHLEESRSHRILWLLEELEASYELKTYHREPDMRAPPAMKRLHPLGKSPIVVVDGAVLVESGAIVEHLVDTFGPDLRPEPGTEAHRRYRHFLHYAEGSLMPTLLVWLITHKVKEAKLPFFVRPIANGIVDKIDESYTQPEIDNHLRFLEGELEDRHFFASDELSAADIQMSYPVEAMNQRLGLARQPNLLAWLERIRSRPAYQRAVDQGGPPVPR